MMKMAGVFPKGLPLGLVWLFDDDWAFHRKAIAPLFATVQIKEHMPVMVSAAENLVKRLLTYPNHTSIDPKDDVAGATIAVIAGSILGQQYPEPEPGQPAFLKAEVDQLLELMQKSVRDPIGWALSRRSKRELEAVHQRLYYDAGFTAVERSRLQPGLSVFLDKLFEYRDDKSGRSFTDAEAVGEFGLMFFAGYETTANTIMFSMYLLGKHPEFQERLRDETRELFGPDGALVYERLIGHKGLDNFFRESGRLYPTVTTINKEAPCDYLLAGHTIPTGSVVMCDLYTAYRNAAYFPEPETFNPDRWDYPAQSQYFLNFGGGPRICVGQRFGALEWKAIIAYVLRDTLIKLDHSSTVEYHTTVTACPRGLRLFFDPR